MRGLKAAGRVAGYGCLRGCLLIVPFLPLWCLLWMGRRLGELIYIASRRRRQIAMKNLSIAFGTEKPLPDRRRIAIECFRQFGMFVFEGMKFAFLGPSEAAKYLHLDPGSRGLLNEAFALNRGVIFVSAHFGNFELAARTIAELGHPMTVVVRPARDQRTTRLMEEMRRRNGILPLLRDNAARGMLAALRRGEAVAILADQNATDVVVPFFGKPTGTVDGPARLALRTGAPIIVGTCRRQPDGTYWTSAEGILYPDSVKPREDAVLRLTAEINELLEQAIRRNPEQWLWFHDRWRSSPVEFSSD